MSVSITSIASGDLISTSRAVLNTNLSNLKAAVDAVQAGVMTVPLTPPSASGWTDNGATPASVTDFTSYNFAYFTALGCDSKNRGSWRTVPASTPYQVTTCFQPIYQNDTSSEYGIAFKETSSGKVIWFKVAFASTGNQALVVSKYSAEQTYVSDYSNSNNAVMSALMNSARPGVWLRVRDDGSYLYFLYSFDGITWIERLRSARNNYFSSGPDLVGFRFYGASMIPAARMLHWLEESKAFTPLSRSGWSATASSTYSGSYPASQAIDGDTGTIWHAGNATYPTTFDLDMVTAQSFNTIKIIPRQDSRTDLGGYEIFVSSDGSSWGSRVHYGNLGDGPETQYIYLPTTQNKRFVRITGHGGTASVGGGTGGAFAFAEVYVGNS